MKKYFYIACAIIFAGCTAQPIEKELALNSDEHMVSVKATIEGFDVDTKTSYEIDTEHNKAKVSWSAGDAISVLYSNGSGGDYSQVSFTTPDGDGNFSGSSSKTESGKFAHWAIYPFNVCNSIWPDNDNSREIFQLTLPNHIIGSGSDAIPMVANTLNGSWDGSYIFKHLGCAIRFSFTNIPSTARYLVIANDTKELAGLYYISYSDGYYTYGNGTGDDGNQREVTYSFTPDAGAYSFFLPFGVGVTPGGNFTFTFKDIAGEVICSRTTTLGTLASTTLARNTMYRVNIDALSFDGYPLSRLTISPSDVPSVSSSEADFSVGGFTFHGVKVDDYPYNDGNNIKLFQDGENKSSRIYNKTDFGRIVRIVVSAGSQNYYNDSFTLYAGSSANTTTSAISYSSHVSGTSSTYILTAGNYHFFTFRINSTSNNQYLGTIDIYYLPES